MELRTVIEFGREEAAAEVDGTVRRYQDVILIWGEYSVSTCYCEVFGGVLVCRFPLASSQVLKSRAMLFCILHMRFAGLFIYISGFNMCMTFKGMTKRNKALFPCRFSESRPCCLPTAFQCPEWSSWGSFV
jgi:hypothetical protein